jgi:hypothetical protein
MNKKYSWDHERTAEERFRDEEVAHTLEVKGFCYNHKPPLMKREHQEKVISRSYGSTQGHGQQSFRFVLVCDVCSGRKQMSELTKGQTSLYFPKPGRLDSI